MENSAVKLKPFPASSKGLGVRPLVTSFIILKQLVKCLYKMVQDLVRINDDDLFLKTPMTLLN